MAIPNFKIRHNWALSYNTAPKHLQSLARSLTNAGLYYTQHEDMVQCYHCKITLDDWHTSHRPFQRHRRRSPQCILVTDRKRRIRLLSDLTEHSCLLAAYYFQAVHRLQHYLTESTSAMGDDQVDTLAKGFWESNEYIKNIYLSLRKDLLQSADVFTITSDLPLSTTDTPLDWFLRSSKLRYWRLHTAKPNKKWETNLYDVWSKIFFHLETFDEVNHFITKERMFRIDNECELVVTCKNCSDKEILKNQMLGNRMYLMEGNQHFTLPQSMLYSLLEMVALWCDICKIKNFVWYTDSDCISCT